MRANVKPQKLRISNVRNPRWSDAKHDGINVDIEIDARPGVTLEFCARENDKEKHGRDMWKDIIAGKYGPIAEYVAPKAK